VWWRHECGRDASDGGIKTDVGRYSALWRKPSVFRIHTVVDYNDFKAERNKVGACSLYRESELKCNFADNTQERGVI
jgi:hypothetical protein